MLNPALNRVLRFSGVALGIAILVLIASSFFPSVDPTKHCNDYKENYNGSFWMAILVWGRIANGFYAIGCSPDFFIAIFTFVIAIFTLLLWWDGSEATKKELRAYIHVEKYGMKVPLVTGEKPQVILEIRNFGSTPARNVSIWSKTEILPAGSDPVIPPNPAFEVIGSIGPNATWASVSYTEEEFGGKDLVLWDEKKAKVFIWGRIDYIDVFNQKRWTSFQGYCGADSQCIVFPDGHKTGAISITKNKGKNEAT